MTTLMGIFFFTIDLPRHDSWATFDVRKGFMLLNNDKVIS